MRVTAENMINELAINDAISGDTITLKYRLPTTEERVRYQKSLVKKYRNKVTTAIAETRQKFGAEILTGFKDGDFAQIKNGKEIAYSADPNNPNYDPEWKNLICTYASDLVEFLAQQVFEGNSRDVDIFDDGDNGAEADEDSSSKNW